MEKIYKKIKPLEELKNIIAVHKKSRKKVVHCHGVFDLIHPGHIRHLAAAKKEGDLLVVTITADRFVHKGPGRPVFNEHLRAETLATMSMVDYVAVNHAPTAVNCIKLLKPDVYVKGQDYREKGKDITGKIAEEEEAILSVGGRLAFTDEITFSSSQLINAHLQVFSSQTRAYLRDIASRYKTDDIFRHIDSIRKLKILVIGEAIVDQYHYCRGMDKSRKSNVVVYKYQSEESFPGGALAIANHLSGLSEQVTLATVLGHDHKNFKDFLRTHIRPNVRLIPFVRSDSATIIKRRFVNEQQKLFEVCYFNDGPLPEQTAQLAEEKIRQILPQYDLVIVSDFGHGFLTDNLVKTICKKAKYLAVNTQTNGANMGFNLITRYSKVHFAALDELEIRYAAHDKTSELSRVMKKVASQIGCKNLMITRGDRGALSLTEAGTLSAPALATDVIDPVGAGDAFFAFTAPLAALKVPQEIVVFAGNAVGALAVQIICNREPVDPVHLKKFITTLLK